MCHVFSKVSHPRHVLRWSQETICLCSTGPRIGHMSGHRISMWRFPIVLALSIRHVRWCWEVGMLCRTVLFGLVLVMLIMILLFLCEGYTHMSIVVVFLCVGMCYLFVECTDVDAMVSTTVLVIRSLVAVFCWPVFRRCRAPPTNGKRDDAPNGQRRANGR